MIQHYAIGLCTELNYVMKQSAYEHSRAVRELLANLCELLANLSKLFCKVLYQLGCLCGFQ